MFRPLALSLALLAAPVAAEMPADLVSVEVLPGWRTDAGTHMAAVRFRLAPGWKTYWRAPGDAGIPPLFTWEGSRNVAAADFHWPVPQVFDQSGFRSIGYADEVVIPVEITPATPDAPARIAGTVEIGVCHDICIPVALQFAADLPAAGRRDAAIAAALVDQPLTEDEAGVGAVTCAVTVTERGLAVTARIELPATGGPEVVVFETADPAVWVSETRVGRQAGVLTASAEMIHASGEGFAFDRSALRITVLGADRAVDIHGCTAG